MAKRPKKPYVPPVGRPLPPPPATREKSEMWPWIRECLLALESWIPLEHDPETMCWHDPRESMSKERWEKISVEEEFSPEARTAFEVLLAEGLWPDTSAQACFVMRARLEWAASLAKQLSLLAATSEGVDIRPKSGHPHEIARWLAFEVYDSRISWPKKWWDGSSFENYYD